MCPFYKSVYIITQYNALLSTTVFATNGKRITLFALIAVKEIDKNYNLVFRRPETKCGFAFCKLYCERRCNAFTHCQR